MPPKIIKPKPKKKLPPTFKTSSPGIAFYKNSNYHLINQYLRTGTVPYGKDPEILDRYIRDIRQTMKANTNGRYPELYRGTDCMEFRLRTPDQVRAKLSPLPMGGRIIYRNYTWKGFVSTSCDIRKAIAFSKGILLVFKTNENTKSADLTLFSNLKHQGEKEILLDHLTMGRITKIIPDCSAAGTKSFMLVEVELL